MNVKMKCLTIYQNVIMAFRRQRRSSLRRQTRENATFCIICAHLRNLRFKNSVGPEFVEIRAIRGLAPSPPMKTFSLNHTP